MKKKIGRPKLPKGTANTVLFAFKLAAKDAEQINEAIEKSGKDKPQWIRTALLSAVNPNKYGKMKIKMIVGELKELEKQSPASASDGGFQNFLVKLHYRVDESTGELELDHEDLEKIHRYAFGYKNGGWQTRLKKIFSRTLGDDLSGMK